jgi:hypothetical protein
MKTVTAPVFVEASTVARASGRRRRPRVDVGSGRNGTSARTPTLPAAGPRHGVGCVSVRLQFDF